MGLNVGNRQPTTCLDALLEEINEEAPGLSKDELLAAIISKFENLFEVFSSQDEQKHQSKHLLPNIKLCEVHPFRLTCTFRNCT